MLFRRTTITNKRDWKIPIAAYEDFQRQQSAKTVIPFLCESFNKQATCLNDLTASLVIQNYLDEIQTEHCKFFRNKRKIKKKVSQLLDLSVSYFLFSKYTTTQLMAFCSYISTYMDKVPENMLRPLLTAIKPSDELYIEFWEKEKEFVERAHNDPDIQSGIKEWDQYSLDQKQTMLEKVARIKCDIWGIKPPYITTSNKMKDTTQAHYISTKEHIELNKEKLAGDSLDACDWIGTMAHEIDHHIHKLLSTMHKKLCSSPVNANDISFFSSFDGRHSIYFDSEDQPDLYFISPTEKLAFEKSDVWSFYRTSYEFAIESIDQDISDLKEQIQNRESFWRTLRMNQNYNL